MRGSTCRSSAQRLLRRPVQEHSTASAAAATSSSSLAWRTAFSSRPYRIQQQHLVRLHSTGTIGETTDDAIINYMKDAAGIDNNLHAGMLKALESVYGKDMTVSNLESFGPTGLKALAESVALEQATLGNNKTMPSVDIHWTIPHHRTEFDMRWKLGESLLDVAHGRGEDLLGEYMEGTCGGHMSCCTCHVYLDQATFDLLPRPNKAEKDMLDLAYDPQQTSRLGCQVQLSQEILEAPHTITVTVPESVNNVWN